MREVCQKLFTWEADPAGPRWDAQWQLPRGLRVAAALLHLAAVCGTAAIAAITAGLKPQCVCQHLLEAAVQQENLVQVPVA